LCFFGEKPVPKIPYKKKPYGVIEGKEISGFGRTLWHAEAKGKLVTTSEGGCSTVFEIAENSFRTHGNKLAVGQRELLGKSLEEGPGGKKFEKLNLSPEYRWLTFNEYKARVRAFSSGMVAFADLKEQDKVVIYADTQVDWMVACLASFTQNVVVVTIYATLGEDGAMHGINQTHARLVICDPKLQSVVQKIAPKCPDLTHMIVLGQTGKTDESSKLKVISSNEILANGKSNFKTPRAPKPSDLAVIMFTSGTTGAPKGVVMTHENLTATVGACQKHFNDFLYDDVYLAYLPLAHIMELCVEIALLSLGLRMGYGNPHTLTDTGVKLQKGCRGDAPVLRPTFMVFAPAVLDKVYSAVQAKVKASGAISQHLFKFALEKGMQEYDKGHVGAPWYCSFIFSKVQQLIGGRVRLMYTGSAPLSDEIQKFVQTVFACPVRQVS